jgi:type VI secretion system lysozyme-like protein
MNDHYYKMTIIDRVSEAEQFAPISEMRERLRKDLEDLLNTRQGRSDIPPWFVELGRSLATYGLNNIDTIDIHSDDKKAKLLQDVHQAIQWFEPRLDDVTVDIDNKKEDEITDGKSYFVLHLRIDAKMRNGAYTDHIVFNTMIQKNGATVLEGPTDA